jgi:hypothetical protein
MHGGPRRTTGLLDLYIRAIGISRKSRNSIKKHRSSTSKDQLPATMFPKSFFILAAVSGCCYAQQTASDVTTGLDDITKGLSDLTDLVKAISGIEGTNVCFDRIAF